MTLSDKDVPYVYHQPTLGYVLFLHFNNISYLTHTKNGPLFTYADRSYLTRHRLNTFLKTALSSSARTPYLSHSAAAGLPCWLIQHLGRWNSNCLKLYIRMPDNTIDMVSTSLVNTKYIGHICDPYSN